MTNLIGLHDREAVQIALPDTWIVDTRALSENPEPTHYNSQFHWICRVNWGYGPDVGTIPLTPDQDGEFLSRLANYVRNSRNCSRWVIGNEPQLQNEGAFHPARYAEFYLKCRRVIRSIPGHEKDEVLIACPGPWNDSYKYNGNLNGDWIVYFTDVIERVGLECDGFALHAYTHGYDPALVMSTTTMDSPFQHRHYNFRVYRDFLIAIPDALAHLPSYITEANGNGPWQAVGLMQEMAREINEWNRGRKTRLVKALCFYRYPDYDQGIKFHIVGKPDVIAEYRATVNLGFQSPAVVAPAPVAEPYVVVTPPDGANIRIGPGTNYKILGAVVQNSNLAVLGRNPTNLWFKVGSQFGEGWVSSSIVKLVNAQNKPIPSIVVSVPVPVDPPPVPPTQLIDKDWLFRNSCRVLGIDMRVAKAIQAIESDGRSFEAGRMIIRFENHIFHDRIKKFAPQLEGEFREHFRYGSPTHTGHQWRLFVSNPWFDQHESGQRDEWEVFNYARTIHETAAMQSISMGSGQIMGFNYADVGYANVQEMFRDYNDPKMGELNQLIGFFAYIVNKKGLLDAVRRKDFETVALLYNGAGNVPTYLGLLLEKYQELGGG